MFEKFKEKCKAFTRNRAAVVTVIILILTLTVVLSVSIATNRAKKQYGINETTDTAGNKTTETPKQTEAPINNGTVEAPSHNATEKPVSGEIEEFKISLPANGTIAKGHDATIQVWSETMGDFRVHLGIDIATEDGAPVYAAADGVVSKIWDDALMGRCMAISHEGEVYTFYKNLSTTLENGIKEGAEVKNGQKIGTVGSTAISELADEPHLHVEMTVNGLAVDPRDYFSDEAKESLTQNNQGK
jgi:murein DD-endopeptidase MepM/ murein hydrolase activator NlpD